MSLVGAKVLRKEDPRLLTGTGTFVDDLAPAGCTFATFVMSTEAHARINSIDVRDALAIDGVLAVYTAADFADHPDLPGGLPDLERPVLARNVVRFVGEPVAIVVAEDRYIAADGVQAVVVDYETLPALTTIGGATADGATVIHPSHGSNVATVVPMLEDLERQLDKADQRAHLRIVNQRCAAVPIEALACLADWKPDGLTLWATFQAPHHLRNYLATWLDVPQTRCRVIAPDVGGGFGSKIVWYPELFVAPLVSKWLGRPVKFAQTRTEAMLQMAPGRDQEHEVDVGFDRDGKIKALRVVISQNLGAYPDPTGVGLAVLTSWMAAGAYRIPDVQTSFRTVVTNTTPVAAYRGAGRPEAAFTIERVVDLVARRTGLDPAEVRRRNFIPPSAFPYATHNEPVVYDSADFPAALDECQRLLDYDAVRAEQAARRSDPTKPLLGIGLSHLARDRRLRAERFARRFRPPRLLGVGPGAGQPGRVGDRVLRLVAARPGPRDGVRPDRVRRAGHLVRPHRGAHRRHGDRASRASARWARGASRRAVRRSRSPRSGCWRGRRRSPPTSSRRASTTSRSPTMRSTCAARPARRSVGPRWRGPRSSR